MKVAVLGGSFDPPHMGHKLIASQVLTYTDMNKVLLMPCYLHPFGKSLTNAAKRLKMVGFLEERSLKASDLEIKKRNISFAIDTLKELKRKSKKDEFYWIIGSDQLENFFKWKDWEEILTKFGMIVFPREVVVQNLDELVRKYLHLKKIPGNIILLNNKDIVLTNISSTKIRNKVKEGKPIKEMVDPHVEKYIMKNKLFK